MNAVTLGIRNAFRNTIRTFSIVIILGLSIGLSLVMLIAHQAVGDKINSVKSSIGNTITIAPAGFNPGSQANNALTTDGLGKVKTVKHVVGLSENLTDRLFTTGSSQPSFGFDGRASSSSGNSTTSLKSPVKINVDSNRSGGGEGFHVFVSGGDSLPSNFSPPVTFLGTNDPVHLSGSSITIKSGQAIDGGQDTNEALVSTDMANKNGLKVGSTFQAYNQTLAVKGIFDSGTGGGNDTVILSLPALQRLSAQGNTVTDATATVDSLDNLSATTTVIKNTLGSSADVTSSQEQADNTVKPLNNVRNVSLYSLIGAVAAGSVIILLTMIMIVRERKREIGVLKAIGSSNLRIMFQFMAEALTLAVMGAVIGLIIGVAAGSPVTKTLVDNSTGSNPSGPAMFGRGVRVGGPGPVARNFSRNGTIRGIQGVQAEIGWTIILDGLGAAVIIAVVGSALSSLFIANIKPAEVLRSE